MNKAQIIKVLSEPDPVHTIVYRSMIFKYLCKYRKRLAEKYRYRLISESYLELLKDLKRIKKRKK